MRISAILLAAALTAPTSSAPPSTAFPRSPTPLPSIPTTSTNLTATTNAYLISLLHLHSLPQPPNCPHPQIPRYSSNCTMMTFHYGLSFSPLYKHELAGDATRIPGCCLLTHYPDTRSIAFKDRRAFFCIAFGKQGCNRRDEWIYVPNHEKGWPDLRVWGWDRRIRAYRCFWGVECGEECQRHGGDE